MPRVHLFVPCYVAHLAPEVARATRAVLERAGCEVVVPRTQTCCGQPAFNAGYQDDARTVATSWLRAFGGAETVVTPSGSCAAMLRCFYPGLLGRGGTPAADGPAARTFELAEYLVDHLGVEDLGATWQGDVTYHDGCHGLRELGVHLAPRRLLARVRGLRLVEMGEAVCCGFGGTFAVKFPGVSVAMADVRLGMVRSTGVATLVSSDVSCLLHLAGRARRRGDSRRFVHLAEILAGA